jgi:hypothetical protein
MEDPQSPVFDQEDDFEAIFTTIQASDTPTPAPKISENLNPRHPEPQIGAILRSTGINESKRAPRTPFVPERGVLTFLITGKGDQWRKAVISLMPLTRTCRQEEDVSYIPAMEFDLRKIETNEARITPDYYATAFHSLLITMVCSQNFREILEEWCLDELDLLDRFIGDLIAMTDAWIGLKPLLPNALVDSIISPSPRMFNTIQAFNFTAVTCFVRRTSYSHIVPFSLPRAPSHV